MSIAVFTPTYNRSSLLQRCYASLLSQTNKDFVWLIVDDGSKDDTRNLVQKWIDDAKISIRYFYQENGGKHKAHNTAVENCDQDYFLIFDSDDTLSHSCIETLHNYISEIENEKDVCGLIANKYRISNGAVIGKLMPKGLNKVSARDLYQKYDFEGDTLRLYKTSILKNFLFPIIPGERFMYENVVFDQIDARYTMKVIYNKLYYCDYLSDGYTANSAKIKLLNPVGYSFSLDSAIKFSVSKQKAINWMLLYIIWCKRMNLSGGFKQSTNKVLYILLYPFALLLDTLKQPRFFFRIIDQKDALGK